MWCLKVHNLPHLLTYQDTTVARLEGAFRTHHKLAQETSLAFMMDGEELELDMTIKDVDIEDMDMIEVNVR
jgi:hypothetical protein